jgi:hypothetical protein
MVLLNSNPEFKWCYQIYYLNFYKFQLYNLLISTIFSCENKLLALFEYDKFNLVEILTHNCKLIVWYTKLVRADIDGVKC